MKSRILLSLFLIGLVVAGLACVTTGSMPIESSPLAIHGATLIDGTGAPPRQHVTIIIEGDRIVKMGQSDAVEIPPHARIVEAFGQFVIPGLWDMHVHLSKAKAEALPMFIANGVTTVRDMGGDIAELRTWQRAIREGQIVGPRILLAGPMLESPETLVRLREQPTKERWRVTRVSVPDSASAQSIVDSVAALGVDFIKIREAISLNVYAAVVRAAERRGLMVAAHPPYSMDPVEAAGLGIASFEHASYPYPLDPDPTVRKRILQAFVDYEVAIVPTLVAWQVSLMDRDSLWALVEDSLGSRDPRRRLISNFLANEWRFDIEGDERKSNETLIAWQNFFHQQAEDLRAMHQAGITLLPGSDLAGPALFPGYALHDELENFTTHVGLTPMEAIESATRLSAELFGRADELGTIQIGHVADLVILNADPIADIANTRQIAGVIAGGRYFGEDEIRRLLGGLHPTTQGKIDLTQEVLPPDE